MADDVAQLEHNNNKCYASNFRYETCYIQNIFTTFSQQITSS